MIVECVKIVYGVLCELPKIHVCLAKSVILCYNLCKRNSIARN